MGLPAVLAAPPLLIAATAAAPIVLLLAVVMVVLVMMVRVVMEPGRRGRPQWSSQPQLTTLRIPGHWAFARASSGAAGLCATVSIREAVRPTGAAAIPPAAGAATSTCAGRVGGSSQKQISLQAHILNSNGNSSSSSSYCCSSKSGRRGTHCHCCPLPARNICSQASDRGGKASCQATTAVVLLSTAVLQEKGVGLMVVELLLLC